jgi:hypothetical protein
MRFFFFRRILWHNFIFLLSLQNGDISSQKILILGSIVDSYVYIFRLFYKWIVYTLGAILEVSY